MDKRAGPGKAFSPIIDVWYDVVYHVLSHLRVAAADASCLYDEEYVRWSDRHFADRGASRTLPADAALMASLYDASKRGSLLHAWPTLWEDARAFLGDIRTDFDRLTWPRADRRRLADEIRADTRAPLAELFRTAVWGELTGGYEAVWEDIVAPRSRGYVDVFGGQLRSLSGALPGLREATWILSLPLRTHGRVVQAGGAAAIAVGVADAQLGVTETHPVIQGCHEYFVWRVQCGASLPARRERWSTVPETAGYADFAAVENAALTVGARFFRGGQWERAYRTWLHGLFPDTPPAETAARLADGRMLTPAMAAVLDGLVL